MKLLFLLFSLLLLLSYGATSSSDGDAVLDSDGDELKAGQLYYATSLGGLGLVSLDESPCPLYAARAHPLDDWGQPLALSPQDERDVTVREGRMLYIMFVVPTVCPESTVWHYNFTDDFVTTGGTTSSVKGPHYSRFALNKKSDSLFQDLNVYGISPSPLGVPQFGDLGLDSVNDKQQLLRVKNELEWGVVFQKVTKKRSTIRSVVEGRL